MTYPIISNITISTPDGDLEGIMEVDGTIWPESYSRLTVMFNGGSLMPAPSVVNQDLLMRLWNDTFKNAYSNADMNRSFISKMKRWAVHSLLKLTPPTDTEAELQQDCRFWYTIDNSPHGYLDILYLDQDLRISKGNRGTYIIHEKIIIEN